MQRTGAPETQLLSAFYGLYTLDDLVKVMNGGELKSIVKNVNLDAEMKTIETIFQAVFRKYEIKYDRQIVSIPNTIKIDKLRFRQLVCAILQGVVPICALNSTITVKISARTGLISNEIAGSVAFVRGGEKQRSGLWEVVEKLGKKVGSEGVKVEANRVTFTFFAGFAAQETPLRLPQ